MLRLWYISPFLCLVFVASFEVWRSGELVRINVNRDVDAAP